MSELKLPGKRRRRVTGTGHARNLVMQAKTVRRNVSALPADAAGPLKN